MDSIFLFVISGCLAILGFVTLLNNPKQRSNLSFFGVTITAIVWIWVNYLSNETNNLAQSTLFNKLIFVTTTLLIYFLYFFSTVYPVERSSNAKKGKLLFLVFTIIILILDISNYLVSNVVIFADHSSIVFGYGIIGYLVHFILCWALFIINIINSYKKAEGAERIRIQYLLAGIFISLTGAGITNLILPIFLTNFDWSNLGPAFLLFFIGFTTLSMIRYRLFGIKFLIAQSLRVITFTLIPILSFYLLLYLLQYIGLNPYELAGICITSVAALIFFFSYTYLINKSQDVFFGKFVYGDISPRDIVNNYAKDISVELDISTLSKKALALIKDLFYINQVGIFVFEDKNLTPLYHDVLGFDANQIDSEEVKIVASFFEKNEATNILIKGEIKKELEKTEDQLLLKLFNLMEANNVNVIIPLNKKVKVNGLIILGTRDDKRDLKAEELSFLDDIVMNTSVAMGRALLYQEVETFNQTLKQKVDFQTKELQIKVLELQEARRKENDMIDIMGHELRTPATVVKLNAELLNKFNNDIKTDPEAYKRYVGRIKTAVENEIKLINTLLSSAKLEGDKIVIDPEEVDIKNEIDMAIHGNEKDANDRYLQLVNNTDPNTPNVYADRARVVEILNNLISNGIKYTEKGNVTVSSKYDDHMIEITVSDTGKGISKEDLPRLGQKFFRVSNYIESSKDDPVDIVRPGGTGLGLYVTFNLVKKMGGDITVESDLGKGSKFIFTLPRYIGQCDGQSKDTSQNMFERLGLKK